MTETIRTLIVDDEPLAIERLQILCSRVPRISLVGTAMEGASALRLIESLNPDLVLLDVQMPGMDGMSVATALASKPRRPAVIFVTAFAEHALTAFDVAAVDYLLKPVDLERFERAIARVGSPALQAMQSGPPRAGEFWVPHRGGVIRIRTQDIDLIEAERDYMRLNVGSSSYLIHETISGLERKLDPSQFVRLHRSTVVQRDRIKGFRHEAGVWEAELRDGRRLRVGRTYLANARAIVRGGADL